MRDELSPSEYARRIGATTRSVQRWITLGKLPARRVGGRWRVAFDVLDATGIPADARVGKISLQPAASSPRNRSTPAPRTLRRLLIADRGALARRIRRTAERLGIVVVEPPTEDPGAIDLLDIAAVVASARANGADAVHPGFGFLAENAAFAEAVEHAGLL